MFRGANKVTLDAKGRMAMPARYRELLLERGDGRLVVTVDRSDRCLLIYPLPDWEEIERKLMRLPTLNAQARRLQRLMVGHATDLELDSHGRVLIAPKLREFAGLSRQATLMTRGCRWARNRANCPPSSSSSRCRRRGWGRTLRYFWTKCWKGSRFAPTAVTAMRRLAAGATRRQFSPHWAPPAA